MRASANYACSVRLWPGCPVHPVIRRKAANTWHGSHLPTCLMRRPWQRRESPLPVSSWCARKMRRKPCGQPSRPCARSPAAQCCCGRIRVIIRPCGACNWPLKAAAPWHSCFALRQLEYPLHQQPCGCAWKVRMAAWRCTFSNAAARHCIARCSSPQ